MEPTAPGSTLLFVDLDGFKRSSTTPMAIRQETSFWLRWPGASKEVLRPARRGGRLGGDQFAVLFGELQSGAGVATSLNTCSLL